MGLNLLKQTVYCPLWQIVKPQVLEHSLEANIVGHCQLK